jgi:hypothetical protein
MTSGASEVFGLSDTMSGPALERRDGSIAVAPAPRQEESFRDAVESWFKDRGVPYFCLEYSSLTRFEYVATFLIAMLAFELGLAPGLEMSVLELIVALATVYYIVLVVPMALARRNWFAIFLAGIALNLIVMIVGDVRVDPWVDAAIIFTGLYAALKLSDCHLWMGVESRSARLRLALALLTFTGVIAFALEGSVFSAPVDQELAALLVMATILLIALILARDAPPAPDFAPRSREVAAMVPSVPVLIVVLGAETAVLPHVPGETWLQTTPLALAAVLFGVSLLAFVRTGRSVARSIEHTHTEKVRQAVVRRKPVASGPKLVAWPLLFLVSYPLLILFFPFEVDAFVAQLEGWSAALVVLAINALFLAAVWLTVAFGIDRFAESVRREWRATAEGIAVALARGLPLLLVFTVFFALTQETWEVAAEEEAMGAYFGLLGSLVGLTVVFILATSALEVRRSSRFDDEGAVKDAALRPQENSPASEPPGEPFATELEALDDGALSDRLSLQPAGWINAALVLTAYQALVFIPVTVVAALLFWGLGKLAVPPEVAAEWIYGDGSPAWRAEALEARSFLHQPWTRVALILGVFSTFYLAVHVQSSREQREQFFGATERGVQQLLSVKLIYDRYMESRRADGS